jgi:hypothetical protein
MSVAEPVALPPVEFTPQNYKVSTLVMRIEAGEIALPEFQRDFLWQPPAIADLLRTVARQWPAGTFLVLEVEDKPAFAFKALKNAPPTDKPKILILDGQQRTTALFHALTDIAGETYFVAMGEIAEAGEFEDDHLRFLKTARFAREYPNVDALAKAKIVKIATLANDLAFNQWCRYLTDAEQDQMLRIRQELLPGLREYDIPAVRLPSDVPLAAIAKIFETLNRTGMRLATFDLMVARLYPYEFKLRDEWEAARANCDQFDDLGIEDGVEVLKVIALREHMRQRDANIKLTVKGVRESDVLALAPQTVIDQWANAVQALANAIDFVGGECGAIRKGLMPSSAMLLPLAHMLAPGSAQREGLRADLVRWFWATSFAQTYAQGANTQAVADTRILSAWQADHAAMPDAVRLFRLDSELLMDGRRRNEMLVRGILCRSVTNNARDWIEDKRFQDLPDKLQVHHIMPDEFLDKHWDGDKDPVVNFALLTESTNKKLRNTLPKDVLLRPDVSHDAIRSHRLDPNMLANADGQPHDYIQRFLEERKAVIEQMIYDAVGVPVPTLNGM